MEAEQNDKNIGKKLDGRYEILERIGEGGMADVYRATDVVDNKTVAVKILKKEFAENEEFLRRFRNESKAIALLSHPNIVKIFDVGFSDRIQFIVMEYIDGFTLNEYMQQQGQLDWRDTVHYIVQILRALQHAHSKGIVHRDIKPQNIMMLQDGTIKVMDFGIAKFAREDGKTGTDKAIGTVHYISPEQACGAATDSKSDLYSVGVMFYEMMTGRKPFDTDNPVSIAVMHMQAEAPQPHTIRSDIHVGLEEIILKAMQKDPKERYQTARDMMNDIETFKENPAVLFGYFPELEKSRANGDIDTSLRGEHAAESAESVKEVLREPVYDDDDSDEDDEEDDEYEEEEEPRSFFVPILSALIIVVIVVGVIFGVSLILDGLNNQQNPNSGEISAMPNLIGMDYSQAKLSYGGQIKIEVISTEYSEYARDQIFDQDIPVGNAVQKGETVNVKVSLGQKKVQIPNLTNYDAQTATQLLVGLGVKVDPRHAYDASVEKDKVISTDPQGPIEVDPQSTVIVFISRGENKNTVRVPNFIGMDWELAFSQAESLGLKLEKSEVNDVSAAGTVLRQSIKATEEVTEGETITLDVSNGIPAEKAYRITFPLPEDASGIFKITVYEGGSPKVEGAQFNTQYANGTTFVSVSGVGTNSFLLTLTNVSTGKEATIGTANINFDAQTISWSPETDLAKAFEAVGGIVTTPPVVTTTPPVVTTTEPVVTASPEA